MEFDDIDKFEPSGLNCTMADIKDVENNVGKLTAFVTYYTRYTSVDKLPILLSFGLGKEIAANAIIGKPTLKEWKGCVDFNKGIFTSEELTLQFDMEYKAADAGLPKNVTFDSTQFIRPHTTFSAGEYIVSIDRGNTSATMHTESDITAATISGTHMYGSFTHSFTTPKHL